MAVRCPTLHFPTSGAFPENVAKKLSRRAEENAYSRRVKTSHRLPCSFSSWRLESPGRPHTARRLGWLATQTPGRGCSLGLGIRPGSGLGPWSRAQALPSPSTTEPGPGAAAPGGHAGEPRRRLQRPERLIAADPSRAHLPPQPPPPALAAGAARSVHLSGAPRGRARSRHESLLGALPVSLLLPASGQRRGELRRLPGLVRFIHYPHPRPLVVPSPPCSELRTFAAHGPSAGREVTSEGWDARSGRCQALRGGGRGSFLSEGLIPDPRPFQRRGRVCVCPCHPPLRNPKGERVGVAPGVQKAARSPKPTLVAASFCPGAGLHGRCELAHRRQLRQPSAGICLPSQALAPGRDGRPRASAGHVQP